MSTSIVIIKKIETFSYENYLTGIQQAVDNANIYCINVDRVSEHNEDYKYWEGVLSELDEEIFEDNWEKDIYTKNCTFHIKEPQKTG